MRKTLLLMGLAGALSAAPSLANAQPLFPGADCWRHRVGGTVLGGVGGGAIGAALAAGVSVTPWAWAAAGVGALVGHAIGVSACRNHWREAYYGYYGGPPPPYQAYPYAYYHYPHGYYDAGYGYYQWVPTPHPYHSPHGHYYAGQYHRQYYGQYEGQDARVPRE